MDQDGQRRRGKPLRDELVERIRKTFSRTGSQRRTARLLSTSRVTVAKIVTGRHGHRPVAPTRLRAGETGLAAAVRCDGCDHFLFVLPCRLCNARQYFARLRSRVAKYCARNIQSSSGRQNGSARA